MAEKLRRHRVPAPANHIRIKYETYKEYEKVLPQLVAHPEPINMDEWVDTGKYPVYPAYGFP